MRQRLAKVAVAVIATGSLAACGGGGAKGAPEASGGGKKPSAHASESAPAPSLKLKVPATYDTSHGWQLSGRQVGTYALLPKAGAVAVMTGTKSGYRVTVRDAVTGEVRWTGKTFKNLAEGEAPGIFVSTVGGKEYLVTWSRGEKGGDAIAKAKLVYAVDVYSADGSGDAVAPARHIEAPASDYGNGRITDGGERLLIPETDKHIGALDVTTGNITTYDTGSVKAPDHCSSCSYGNEIVALTQHDPVVSNEGAGSFGVPGSWDSSRIAPAQADPATGAVWPSTGGHLIARWGQKSGGDHNVWAVLDSKTGQVQASVMCAKPFIGPAGDPDSALSPKGRYLVSEHLAFDLKSKKGYCFEESDSRKPLTFDAVTDDGIAYGTSLTKGSLTGTKAAVQLSLATGAPKALPDNSSVPIADFAGVGIFSHAEGNVPYLIVYRHKG
ncbi:hypothetical protein [Streptomyces sp. NRRL S-1448]|uniref:hypothetical protein n=1 Tax=Streptomyces sp. NRRL S-1448 TaxID=1463883 RepID=UPI0004BE6D1E|nr:hypothetical protein [Streptomyces sp. NRRL S-1448]